MTVMPDIAVHLMQTNSQMISVIHQKYSDGVLHLTPYPITPPYPISCWRSTRNHLQTDSQYLSKLVLTRFGSEEILVTF